MQYHHRLHYLLGALRVLSIVKSINHVPRLDATICYWDFASEIGNRSLSRRSRFTAGKKRTPVVSARDVLLHEAVEASQWVVIACLIA